MAYYVRRSHRPVFVLGTLSDPFLGRMVGAVVRVENDLRLHVSSPTAPLFAPDLQPADESPA
jgi:hypothetical protein